MIYMLKLHVEELDENTGKSKHHSEVQVGPSFYCAAQAFRWTDRLLELVAKHLPRREV